MSKKPIGTPPKIGMEIEANWPAYDRLPAELRDTFIAAGTKIYPSGSLYAGPEMYNNFMRCSGPKRMHRSSVPTFYEVAPAKFQYPDGWDKGHDSGVEMRFDGPANTLSDAEDLIKRGSQWLRDFGFNMFSHAGTHVHLGHVAWCNERFGSNYQDPILCRAESLMWGYFATREEAIFQLSAQHRRTCGSCNPIWPRSSLYHAGSLSPTLPVWAFHNYFLTHPYPIINCGLNSSSLQMRRKGLPTLEFRHFTGTHATTALLGYVRLLYTMFLNATKVVTEENLRAATEDSMNAPIVVNPHKYTVDDLKKEIEDPWLLKWIGLTIKNRGEPITAEISIEETRIPLAVAAA